MEMSMKSKKTYAISGLYLLNRPLCHCNMPFTNFRFFKKIWLPKLVVIITISTYGCAKSVPCGSWNWLLFQLSKPNASISPLFWYDIFLNCSEKTMNCILRVIQLPLWKQPALFLKKIYFMEHWQCFSEQ